VGAAAVANLTLIAFDIRQARQARDRILAPKEALEARPSTG
jgi:hypothetical protein